MSEQQIAQDSSLYSCPNRARVGLTVLIEDEFLGFRQHPPGAAGGVVNGAENAWRVDILLTGVDQIGHQADDLARG